MLASGIHKSIRRGHLDLAREYADRPLRVEPSYLSYRLGTIALEEVGPGDWGLVGDVLKKIRGRESSALPGLAARLAEAAKSRTVVYAKARHPADRPDLFATLVDGLNRHALPPLGKFLAEYGRGFEKLGAGVPRVWGMVESSQTEIVTHAADESGDELIAGFPAAAYDRHTLEGKAAIRYFHKALNTPFTQEQVSWAIFDVEGPHVGPQELTFPGSDELRAQSFGAGYRERGTTHPDQILEITSLVRQKRELLNKVRKLVLAD